MLKPVALEEQAKELLSGGNYDQALKLAEVCAADGAPWAEEAFAEAAFLLMQGVVHRGAHRSHLMPVLWLSVSALPGCSQDLSQHVQSFFTKVLHRLGLQAYMVSLEHHVAQCHMSAQKIVTIDDADHWLDDCPAELRFAEAMKALQHCSTLVMQPAELFALFPEPTRPWAGLVHAKPFWGLHPPLTDLRSLVESRLHSACADSEHMANGGAADLRQRLVLAAEQCVAEYLLEVVSMPSHIWPLLLTCVVLQQILHAGR
jgi:hypothetical protein